MRLVYEETEEGQGVDTNMSSYATTTPANFAIDNNFGFTTNGRNFVGLLSINFLPSITVAGYSITNQLTLLTLAFQNLTAVPTNALFVFSGNQQLLSFSAPSLSTIASNFTITNNAKLVLVDFPALISMTGTASITTHDLLATINFLLLNTVTGNLSINDNISLTTFTAPLLATVTGATQMFGNISLTSISLPSLTNGGTSLNFQSNDVLTTLSLPALVTGGTGTGGLVVSFCPLLSNVTLTNYLPTNARPQNFGGCALSQASVDHILARCVANAAYVSGTVTLNGGTNSTPSAAGLINKATLVGRGVTVLNN